MASIAIYTVDTIHAIADSIGNISSMLSLSLLNKTVEREMMISDIVFRVRSPSEAWTILNSMIDNDSGLVKDK